MLPIDKLHGLTKRFREIDHLLYTPEVASDAKQLRALGEERSKIEPLVQAFEQYLQTEKGLRESEEALTDPELKELAQAEIPELQSKLVQLEKSIQLLLLPVDPRDQRDVIVEIRAGEGGEEAALFAADLLRMYSRFAETRRWKVELLNESMASAGGYKEVVAQISGQSVFSQLRFEGGVHRVQRVPATEAQGRIHTSTASVIVMAEADELDDVYIDEKDLEINIAASGGPGGQGVNTTNSAVQIQHKPTGIIVKCQDQRSQLKNKAKAMQVLKTKLMEIEREKREAAASAERKTMVQSADRSQKVRTYNYPQNRITDHRIGLTLYKLERVVNGDLDELIGALRAHYQAELLHREGLGDAPAPMGSTE